MASRGVADEQDLGPDLERLRPSESYIHWDRGMAIVAAIVGVTGLFFLLLVVLPIREPAGPAPITGIATPEAVVARVPTSRS
jgi:hypothetical protein